MHVCVCVCPPLRPPRTSSVDRVSDPCGMHGIRPDIYIPPPCLVFLSIRHSPDLLWETGNPAGVPHSLEPGACLVGLDRFLEQTIGKRQKKKLNNGKRQICLCACVYVTTLAPVTLVIHRERALDNNSGNININQTLMHRFNATLDELELKEHHSRQ
jgi:hypothetical protein